MSTPSKIIFTAFVGDVIVSEKEIHANASEHGIIESGPYGTDIYEAAGALINDISDGTITSATMRAEA